MARRITEEDIININNLYLKYGTYSGVAAELGMSPATVKKYIIPEYRPDIKVTNKFTEDMMPEFDPSVLEEVEDFGDLCELSEEENKEVKVLWKELVY